MTPPATQGDDGPVRPVVFLHLPKTAGSTLKAILDRAYEGHERAFLTNLGGEIRAFASKPESERRRHALLTGHMPWGAQVLIPGSRAITMLRDPVERFLSVYYFNKRAPRALHHRTINEHDLSLADVIEQKLFLAEYNMMTSMLRDPRVQGAGPALDSAKRNLKACLAFGIAERFTESIEHFTDVLRWPSLTWEDRNVTEGRPRAGDVEPGVLERIRHETGVDRRLYDYALELFDERLRGGGR